MTATRIIQGLERIDATGTDAAMAARLGFLEWAFGARIEATPQAARTALADPILQNASSPAARAFVNYLREATRTISRPTRRRRVH